MLEFKVKPGTVIRFDDPADRSHDGAKGATGGRAHLLSKDEIDAVSAAMAAGRPLLLRGEPGTGKSQLAEAVARHIGLPFIRYVIDAKTEASDLFFEVDHVQRLADAQVVNAASTNVGDPKSHTITKIDLSLRNYVRPGPFWWAFDWKTADKCRLKHPPNVEGLDWKQGSGSVVLLDEIDKADSDIPNGLLEALGDLRFRSPEGESISCIGEPPFVVVTTNEERDLPDAFIRRCFSLRFRIPKGESEFRRFLVERGVEHFPAIDRGILDESASMIFADRENCPDDGPRPGLAEYLDLLRVLHHRAADSVKKQRELMEVVRPFVFKKYDHADDDTE